MSVRVISAVFEESKSTGAARLVLLAIADVAADSGEVTAYPRSHKILAKKANIDERSVSRVLDVLIGIGEVKMLRLGDGRKPSDYQVILPSLGITAGSSHNEGRQDATPGRTTGRGTGGRTPPQGRRDATPINTSLSTPTTSSSAPAANLSTTALPMTGETAKPRVAAAREAMKHTEPATVTELRAAK